MTSYDAGQVTRAEVGQRFRVSEALVKKLLQQRRKTGEIGPRHDRSGRQPRILPAHRERLRALLAQKPDLTLAELRSALALTCSLPAIHYALAAMALTFHERRSMPPKTNGRRARQHGDVGSRGRTGATPRGLASAAKRASKKR
ncbi:MAG: hypothetical protein RL077_676 [Verrucomicrobiota bacterium]